MLIRVSPHFREEGRRLLQLGSPILLSQLLQASVILVDTLMAGRYAPEDLSGVAIGGSIWFPVVLFLVGVGSALTPTVAQCHGRGESNAIPHWFYQALWLMLLILPPVMAGLAWLPDLLVLIRAESALHPIIIGYLSAIVVGLPGLMFYNLLRFYSDGISLTQPALWASALALLLNVPLNYMFIFGKWGAPELGGVGCGIASAIVFYVMFLFMLAVTLWRRHYRPFFLYARLHAPRWTELRQLFSLGLPIGVANFIEASMFGVIALFLASRGTVEVAAHQIALNMSSMVFMIPFSLGMALTIRCGYLLGSGDAERARFTALMGVAVGLVYALLSAAYLYLLRFEIAALYTPAPEVIALAGLLFSYAALFQIGDAMQVTASGALRGYKDTRAAMAIMLISFWCLAVPLGYTLGLTEIWGPARGAVGFWQGLVLGLLVAGSLLVWRLWRVSGALCAGQSGECT